EMWDAFFSDFYLRAFAADERDEAAEAQALAAARLAGVEPGQDPIDLPCGVGRHAIPLARAGFAVTGIDRSATLREEARRRADSVSGCTLVTGDYRSLPFADGSFDGAVCLFTSLGYLGDEQDTHVLAEIGRVLRPGTRLVIEIAHRDTIVTSWNKTGWHLLGEGRLLLEQRTFDPASGVAQTTQTLVDGASRESRTWSVRTYTATELLAMLARAGFAEARAYGGFDASPLTTGSRLVIVAITGAESASA